MALGSERVRQWPVFLLALVASRVETVQSVLRHVVVARSQTELRRAHARNISTIPGHRRLSQLLSRLCANNKRQFDSKILSNPLKQAGIHVEQVISCLKSSIVSD